MDVERRRKPRYPESLPVLLCTTTGDKLGSTQDISSIGAYINVCCDGMAEGSAVEFVLDLPAQLKLTAGTKVFCKGRVVRINQTASGGLGVALRIDAYEFIRPS